ncbi:hypothetical protein CUJ83_10205 [Methanocella sp. CWC-04]|uniref:Uncharacterized protein n=1 Tax=Methanooceanicella nereidis TaxID=2052831 RepID=A0AAP2RF16_9EURY|nr:hypothetical protein [Methanocella sp. CWC-04]
MIPGTGQTVSPSPTTGTGGSIDIGEEVTTEYAGIGGFNILLAIFTIIAAIDVFIYSVNTHKKI